MLQFLILIYYRDLQKQTSRIHSDLQNHPFLIFNTFVNNIFTDFVKLFVLDQGNGIFHLLTYLRNKSNLFYSEATAVCVCVCVCVKY